MNKQKGNWSDLCIQTKNRDLLSCVLRFSLVLCLIKHPTVYEGCVFLAVALGHTQVQVTGLHLNLPCLSSVALASVREWSVSTKLDNEVRRAGRICRHPHWHPRGRRWRRSLERTAAFCIIIFRTSMGKTFLLEKQGGVLFCFVFASSILLGFLPKFCDIIKK